MAKKAAKKKTVAKKADKAADALPGMPGNFVVIGLGSKQNEAMAAAIRRKLAGN
jgi:hypothetical protein